MNAAGYIRDTLSSLASSLHPPELPRAIDTAFTKVRSPAGELFLYEDTRGRGAPVVFVHSVNAAASSYEVKPLFEGLRGERPVFAFDLPGFGLSQRGARRYDRGLFREALVAMLERVQAFRGLPADVVALSLGCEFAAEVALERPDLVRSLTLISPTGLGQSRDKLQGAAAEGRKGAVRLALETPIVGAPLFMLIASGPSVRYFLAKSFVGPVDKDLAHYAWLSAHQPGARHAPLAFLLGELFNPEVLASVYQRLSCPVQVIYDEDAYSDFSRLPEVLSRPGWTATRVAPTRGLPQFEKPKSTLDAMRAFWAPLQLDEARMDEARAHQAGF
jgi:pimeloyl-ACP methyl ester carboxylesterase